MGSWRSTLAAPAHRVKAWRVHTVGRARSGAIRGRRDGDGLPDPGPGQRAGDLARHQIVPGIEARGATAVLVAAIVLGMVNAVVRPVLLILTLPLTLVTLGLFLFVLNALCLWLTSAVVPGFDVRGFWPAFWGALLVSALSWVVNGFVSDRGRVSIITERDQPPPRDWRALPRR